MWPKRLSIICSFDENNSLMKHKIMRPLQIYKALNIGSKDYRQLYNYSDLGINLGLITIVKNIITMVRTHNEKSISIN